MYDVIVLDRQPLTGMSVDAILSSQRNFNYLGQAINDRELKKLMSTENKLIILFNPFTFPERGKFFYSFLSKGSGIICVYLEDANNPVQDKTWLSLSRVFTAQALIDTLNQAVLISEQQNEDAAISPAMKNKVSELTDYIEHNLSDDLSLSTLASKMYLSRSHLSRIFRAVKGVSISDYVADMRIEQAKIFLRSGDLPIQEIAALVGYDKINSFNHLFKAKCGISPGQYRTVSRKR